MNHKTKKRGAFGFTHPDRPLFTMCQCCKNEDTQLERVEEGRHFYSCLCGAHWNFSVKES